MSDGDGSPRGHTKPLRAPSVAWQSIDGEAVLLRYQEKELLGLNDVGRRLWEMSDGRNSVDQMVEAVAAEYEVSLEAARADVASFLRELMSMGALTADPG
jgi:hypothetical protein